MCGHTHMYCKRILLRKLASKMRFILLKKTNVEFDNESKTAFEIH
jgi:hypothetical protein